MAFARNGDVRLYFEEIGDPAAPSVLLLNGAGRQCIDFPDEFCQALASTGFHVIRFDQRDTGLSTDFADHASSVVDVADAIGAGRQPSLSYRLDALAADAIAVIDMLGKDRVHLFGRSLGSLVAQAVALDHPCRVISMTLAIAMSRSIGGEITRERLARLDSEHFADEAAFVARQVETAKAIGNPAYFDGARARAEAAQAYRRGVHKGAIARHFTVGLAAPDLRPRLAGLDLPVQVVHGRLDRVIPLAYAQETAAVIPGARLAILEDMAHEAPPQLWERWVDLFVANAARASN